MSHKTRSTLFTFYNFNTLNPPRLFLGNNYNVHAFYVYIFLGIYWFTCEQHNLDKSMCEHVGLEGNKKTYYYVDGTGCTCAKITREKKNQSKVRLLRFMTQKLSTHSCHSSSAMCLCLVQRRRTRLPMGLMSHSLIIVSGSVWSCTIICMVPIVWVRLCWAVEHWCGSLRPVIAGLINYTELRGIQI